MAPIIRTETPIIRTETCDACGGPCDETRAFIHSNGHVLFSCGSWDCTEAIESCILAETTDDLPLFEIDVDLSEDYPGQYIDGSELIPHDCHGCGRSMTGHLHYCDYCANSPF